MEHLWFYCNVCAIIVCFGIGWVTRAVTLRLNHRGSLMYLLPSWGILSFGRASIITACCILTLKESNFIAIYIILCIFTAFTSSSPCQKEFLLSLFPLLRIKRKREFGTIAGNKSEFAEILRKWNSLIRLGSSLLQLSWPFPGFLNLSIFALHALKPRGT